MRKTQRLAHPSHGSLNPQLIPAAYRDGERFGILGKEYTLHIYYYSSKKVEWYLNGSSLNLYLYEGYLKNPAEERALVKRMVESFLHERAEIEIEESAKRLGALINLTPQKLTVKKMIRDWGRCSPLGNITINQEIVAYDKEVIDYVVLRELLHLKYNDEDPEFAHKLKAILPEIPAVPSRF